MAGKKESGWRADAGGTPLCSILRPIEVNIIAQISSRQDCIDGET